MNRYIYVPRGRAQEYGSYALNLYNGCSHGCTYCYVPAVCHRTREDFHGNVSPRLFDWHALKREIADHRGRDLFLCFTCDPYQPLEKETDLTRDVIEQCHKNDVKVIILTKGGSASEKDFDLLAARPDLSSYGITLTFTSAEDSRKYEPHAALPLERISALGKANFLGIPTWVSLEPVIDPMQSLDLIHLTRDFANEFKIGKRNHSKDANIIDWSKFVREAVKIMQSIGARYYIKEDLAVYLEEAS